MGYWTLLSICPPTNWIAPLLQMAPCNSPFPYVFPHHCFGATAKQGLFESFMPRANVLPWTLMPGNAEANECPLPPALWTLPAALWKPEMRQLNLFPVGALTHPATFACVGAGGCIEMGGGARRSGGGVIFCPPLNSTEKTAFLSSSWWSFAETALKNFSWRSALSAPSSVQSNEQEVIYLFGLVHVEAWQFSHFDGSVQAKSNHGLKNMSTLGYLSVEQSCRP